MNLKFKSTYLKVLAIFIIPIFSATSLKAQNKENNPNNHYFTVEDYYKAKWGHADEFISLWKKNHLPLLREAEKKGDIISIKAEKPRLHSGEDVRWDYRVTVVFKTAELAFDETLLDPFIPKLYPDQEKHAKEEVHRFEILDTHWDLETESDPLN